jgi:uncharacterized protein YegP (UPF0339 family)
MKSPEYKKARNGKWYFTITADNGRQLVSSQRSYNSAQNARKGFDALHEWFTGFNAGKELKKLSDTP